MVGLVVVGVCLPPVSPTRCPDKEDGGDRMQCGLPPERSPSVYAQILYEPGLGPDFIRIHLDLLHNHGA